MAATEIDSDRTPTFIKPKKRQFGIRTLFLLTSISAVAIVTCQFLGVHLRESWFWLFLYTVALTILGAGLIVFSLLFALCIVIADDDPITKRENLVSCGYMLLFGLAGFAPMLLLFLVGLSF